MSRLTDIYNALKAKTTATLPTYVSLADVDELDRNTNIGLTKGFAIGVSTSTPGDNQMSCRYQQIFERVYTVSLTNMDVMRTDDAARAEAKLELMEDLYAVTKAVLEDPTNLAQSADSIQFTGDSGPQYMEEDSQEFLFAVVSFTIGYEETFQS